MIDLDKLERWRAAATPGPWEALDGDVYAGEGWAAEWPILSTDVGAGNRHYDAAYVAAAYNALPELIDKVRSLREIIRSRAQEREDLYAKLRRVEEALMTNGCDCDCSCDDVHFDDCVPCFPCVIQGALDK